MMPYKIYDPKKLEGNSAKYNSVYLGMVELHVIFLFLLFPMMIIGEILRMHNFPG